MQLFRQQVLANRRPRLEGEVLVLPRPSHSLLLAALLLWTVACGLWLTGSEFTRKESVRGWLSPESGVLRVYAPAGGLVGQLLVREGELVSEGQALLTINGDHTLADGEQLQSLLLEELSHQRDSLERQLRRSHTRLGHRHRQLQQELSATGKSLELTDGELATLRTREQLLSTSVQRLRALANDGHLARAELDNARQEQLAMDSARRSLLRTRAGLQQRLEAARTQLQLLPAEHDDQLDNLQLRISDIAQRMVQLRGNRTRVITAPFAGRVNNLQVEEGQRAVPGIPLLSIVPPGQRLRAQLLVPVRAAGFIQPGQQLQFRYDAFPYQKFGLFPGSIEKVSHAVQLPGEVHNSPIPVAEPTYRVHATLGQQQITAFDQTLPLRPGMTFSADIVLGSRSLLEWLLEPLYSLRGRL